MKKVIKDEELRKYIDISINLLCDTVKKTLGPKGCNVIIDHSSFSPFITNDGVTVAMNIESEDEVINTILELAKSSSIKTNEVVGDGTTTTLVLMQSIYNNGLKYIYNGENPIILKQKLLSASSFVIKELKKQTLKINNKRMFNIAFNASGDKEIASNLIKAYEYVKDFNFININETNYSQTTIQFYSGYIVNYSIPNEYYFKFKDKKEYNNIITIILNYCVNDINNLSDIINEYLNTESTLLIIANNFSDYFVNNIVDINENYNLNILLFIISEAGSNQKLIYKDLEVIANCNMANNEGNILYNNIGRIDKLILTGDNLLFNFKNDKKIEEYRKKIIFDRDIIFDKDFVNKRIGMFGNGICEIMVGCNTQIENREKKMKYDDALCALKVCKNGVLPGCGISLIKVIDKINSNDIGFKIYKDALNEVFKQIMINSGINYKYIYEKIKSYNYTKVYNILNNKFENICNSSVIDSYDVVSNALTNATSIACMLMTTTSIVINEEKNKVIDNFINNI